MTPFGCETISRLTEEEMQIVLADETTALQNLISFTHINPRLPDQNNVLLTNLRSGDCFIVSESGRNRLEDWNEVSTTIVMNAAFRLYTYLTELHPELDSEPIQKIKSQLEILKDPMRNKKEMKLIKKVIKLDFYNDRFRQGEVMKVKVRTSIR